MKILFWNLKHNQIASYVARCAVEHKSDIICLAEHQGVLPNELVELLGNEYRWVRGVDYSKKTKVIVFARSSVTQISNGQISEPFHRYVIWSFMCEGKSYNLVAVHMVDKKSESDSLPRCMDASKVMADLLMREEQSGCVNSIIIGDFNSDPFESPMIAKSGFNATLFKDVIDNHPIRRRNNESYRMMYNPVIHYLSEETKCYGSFYWGKDFSELYWHCYDQALVSASLVNSIRDFQYLRTISNESLLLDVRPNSKISDHLPLLLTIGGTEYE